MLRKILAALSCKLGMHNWMVHRKAFRYTDERGNSVIAPSEATAFGVEGAMFAVSAAILFAFCTTLVVMLASYAQLSTGRGGFGDNPAGVLLLTRWLALGELVALGCLYVPWFFNERQDRSCLRCGKMDLELSEYEDMKSKVEDEYRKIEDDYRNLKGI